MNTIKLTKNDFSERNYARYDATKNKTVNYWAYLIFCLLSMLWPLLQDQVSKADPTIGFIDPNIWLLILIGLISFMIVTGLCWWLLHRFWMSLGLPTLHMMVSQFKNLPLCQQLGFYWLSFASLLLAAVGVLSAVL